MEESEESDTAAKLPQLKRKCFNSDCEKITALDHGCFLYVVESQKQ